MMRGRRWQHSLLMPSASSKRPKPRTWPRAQSTSRLGAEEEEGRHTCFHVLDVVGHDHAKPHHCTVVVLRTVPPSRRQQLRQSLEWVESGRGRSHGRRHPKLTKTILYGPMNASSAPWSSPPSLTALYQLGSSRSEV